MGIQIEKRNINNDPNKLNKNPEINKITTRLKNGLSLFIFCICGFLFVRKKNPPNIDKNANKPAANSMG